MYYKIIFGSMRPEKSFFEGRIYNINKTKFVFCKFIAKEEKNIYSFIVFCFKRKCRRILCFCFYCFEIFGKKNVDCLNHIYMTSSMLIVECDKGHFHLRVLRLFQSCTVVRLWCYVVLKLCCCVIMLLCCCAVALLCWYVVV